jgi:hypothetical protein
MLMTFMDSLYQQARANTELLSKLVTDNAELRAENDKLRKAPFKPKSERHASSSGEGKSKLAGAKRKPGSPKSRAPDLRRWTVHRSKSKSSLI